MAKKKKSQLKPIARGFATTSVPKKVPVVSDDVHPAADENETPEEEHSRDDSHTTVVAGPLNETNPDKMEEQLLQDMVDRFQDKTEKEISRTVKAFEYERRFARTFSRIDLDQTLRDKVFRLILDAQSSGEAPRLALGDTVERLTSRLGITYGVLRRLGFSEARVQECVSAISGVDLDEAFDWLYIHCTEDELESEERSRERIDPQTPHTPRTPEPPSTPSAPNLRKKPYYTDSRPSPSSTSQRLAPSSESEEGNSDVKSRILASQSDSEADILPNDDPNKEYVRLKMQISDLISDQRTPREKAANYEFLNILGRRLAEVQKHYFFNEKDAEAEFQAKRQEVDVTSLQSRLRGNAISPQMPSTPSEDTKRRPHPLQSQPKIDARQVVDIFEDQDDGSPDGLLELLEPMPASETTATGYTITVRDMALPKNYAGRTPKILLREWVSKTDRCAAVTYYDLSGASRAKRSSLTIRWGGGRTETWAMEDVACHNTFQADQYMATIAMHALTFPLTAGFANGGTGTGGGQTSFRLLPTVFRDLWDELEVKRKESEDEINRGIWARLKAIAIRKLETMDKSNGKIGKSSSAIVGQPSQRILPGQEYSAEQLIAGFQARQASPAYQVMLAQRNTLPIAFFRQNIIDTLETSQILVLSGETGCGKSTQLPSFILEDQLLRGKPCKIVCTEPRRISAISLAQRVSRELGDVPGAVGTMSSLVGYSIRLESHTTKNTRLTFVTNGIALRMLEGGTGNGGHGTAFDEITHVIVDEVHERSIESDFLLIVLKSLLKQRKDLKVILMSATLDADKISNFFGECPTLHVPGRTFPVNVKYLEDAIEFTQWSIAESSQYAKRKHDKFYRGGKHKLEWSEDTAHGGDDDDDDTTQEYVKLEQRYSSNTHTTINLLDERLIPYDLIIRLLEKICFEDETYLPFSSAILVFMPGLGEIRRLNDMLAEHRLFGSSSTFRIYPLHSTISSENQGAAFDVPPAGVRKLVIATNIAETGITIPDITCVIDSGKHREMRFDEKRQISRLIETFISRSNAAQRRGRAGRVQSGLCFHLFTKLRHDLQLAEHQLPEMMRLSLSDLALRIKIMKVKLGSSIEDVLLQALDPPASINIQRAVSVLVEVQALTPTEEITPMGRLLSKLPTDVHLGKFLLIATLFRCLDPALTIAATLNSKSPFVSPMGLEEEADRAKGSFKVDNSDFLTIHNAFASWRRASANPAFVRKFCRQNFLSHQNLQQIEELRQQFLGYLIDSSFIAVDQTFVRELSRARYGRNRTRFVTVPVEYDCNTGDNTALINAALCAGLYPKLLTIDTHGSQQLRTLTNNQAASFHPSSVNFGRKPSDFWVNHLCYFTIMHSKRLYAWETSPVDDISILLLCGDCDFKLASDSAIIDKKIKFRIAPKSNIALKHLRAHLVDILGVQLRGKPLTETQSRWNELALMVLGKVKVKENGDATPSIMVH